MVDRKSSVRECRNNKSQLHPPCFPYTRQSSRVFDHVSSLTSLSLTSILYRTGNYRIRVIHANPSVERASNYYRTSMKSISRQRFLLYTVTCHLYLVPFFLYPFIPASILHRRTTSQDHAVPVLFVADHSVESGEQERLHKWRGYSVKGENDGRQGVKKGI